MFRTVDVPLWLLVLIVLFAAVTFASHFLFPSVRWFLRRRAERIVSELNKRLDRPIQPFKLLRRTDMIQRLIYDPQVMEAVAQHAQNTGVREDVAFEQARRYAREIVPGFSASVYFGFATRAAKWLSTLLYDVEVRGEQRIQEIDPDATVIFVMNHRSNMDYVLVTYVAAQSSALAYAVGEWARVWPLRSLIRALGGYFIRRQYRTSLYRRVLARYVQMATGAGVAQAVFPEGGLSLDGRIAQPKLGLLSYIVEDYRGSGRDIVFVPVALNYDRVLEDQILLSAGRSGARRFRGSVPEAVSFGLRYVIRRLTRRGHRMGHAGVVFGSPLSLKAFPHHNTGELASEIMKRIGTAMPVLAVPVASQILLESGPLDGGALSAEIVARLAALDAAGATVLADPETAADEALAILSRRGLVTEDDGQWRVREDRRSVLAYYAASLGGVSVPETSQEAGKADITAT